MAQSERALIFYSPNMYMGHWLVFPLVLACDEITMENKEKKGTLSRSLRAGVRKPTITWAGDDLTARSSERKRRGKPSACRDWTELLCKGGTEKKGGGACVCG